MTINTDEPIHPRSSRWYCLRTAPRAEERAKRSLRRLGLNAYAPVMKIERQHRRTKRWHTRTLMVLPGYVFAEMPAQPPSWMAVTECDGVMSVLGVANAAGEVMPFPISSQAIERLMAMQANMELDDTRAARIRRREIGRTRLETVKMSFPIGSRVRAKDGPFASFRGLVTNIRAHGEVEALVELLGRLVPTAFRPEQIERDDEVERAA